MVAYILPTTTKKQNRVYANIQRDFELNVESMLKLIMIKNNGHEVLASPCILESVIKKK